MKERKVGWLPPARRRNRNPNVAKGPSRLRCFLTRYRRSRKCPVRDLFNDTHTMQGLFASDLFDPRKVHVSTSIFGVWPNK